jgi:hypothetical protein
MQIREQHGEEMKQYANGNVVKEANFVAAKYIQDSHMAMKDKFAVVGINLTQ